MIDATIVAYPEEAQHATALTAFNRLAELTTWRLHVLHGYTEEPS